MCLLKASLKNPNMVATLCLTMLRRPGFQLRLRRHGLDALNPGASPPIDVEVQGHPADV